MASWISTKCKTGMVTTSIGGAIQTRGIPIKMASWMVWSARSGYLRNRLTLPGALGFAGTPTRTRIPDIFDQDDDGDGVPSIVDASAVGYDSQIYSQTNPFKMSVSNLATDDIFLTYQLKPTNPEHLTYSMNVLDWPSGDTDGQIMRISETTFMDQLAPEKRAGDPKADKGDLRLIPMLEIKLTGSTLAIAVNEYADCPDYQHVGQQR